MDVTNLGHEDGIPESLPQCGDCLFFSFLSKNVQNMSKTLTRRDFSRLFGVDVLWRHRWNTSGMGLSHPPGWDNISPDVKIGGYSCLKNENNLSFLQLQRQPIAFKNSDHVAAFYDVVRNTWPYTPPLTVIWTDRGGVGSERIVYWKPEIFTTLRGVVNNTLYLHIKSFVRVLTYHDRQVKHKSTHLCCIFYQICP